MNENVSERLTSPVSEVASKTRDMVVWELSSFKQGVTEKNLNFLQERVDTVSTNNDAKLGEMSSQLDKLQEQLVIASCNQNVSQLLENLWNKEYRAGVQVRGHLLPL
jgi:vacuolar-type H+-ATPase subunit E/Vma4